MAYSKTARGVGEIPLVAPRRDLGLAANLLYMLRGEEADPEEIRAVDVAIILHAEHGMNASTFAARVTAANVDTGAVKWASQPIDGQKLMVAVQNALQVAWQKAELVRLQEEAAQDDERLRVDEMLTELVVRNGSDLHLKLKVESHPHFRREGNDVILTAPLSLSEAVLGCRLDVPTLDGGLSR